MNVDKSLADILVEDGHVGAGRLDQILAGREDTTEPLGDLLVRLGVISDWQRLRCLALQSGLPSVDLATLDIDPAIARLVSRRAAMRLKALPVEATELSASVAMVNPLDLAAIDELKELTGRDIDPMWASRDDLEEAIVRAFETPTPIRMTSDPADLATKEPPSRQDATPGAGAALLSSIFDFAARTGAEDLHFDPVPEGLRVRMRASRSLQDEMAVGAASGHALLTRLKSIAGLASGPRSVPQTGRCSMTSPRGNFELTVSTHPCVSGERVHVRLDAPMMDGLAGLGMLPESVKRVSAWLARSQGLILASGPVRSGRTTTLYAALRALEEPGRIVMTIEDPVERRVPGAIQSSVDLASNLSFPSGLRSILRQDPDVILVGDLRDSETACLAIEAALSGRLVLASLDAPDAVGALGRLVAMGVDPSRVASSVAGVLGQVLIRTSCDACLRSYRPARALLQDLGLPAGGGYRRGFGCDECAMTGYRGRIALFECLESSPDLVGLLANSSGDEEVRTYAEEQGLEPLFRRAAYWVREGRVDPEEIRRCVPIPASVSPGAAAVRRRSA